MSAFYNKPIFTLFANLSAIGAATYYQSQNIKFNHEESEARFDEMEGTLRGHIGLIEDALDRLEGKKSKEGETSKKDQLYEKRTRDEKKGDGKK